MNLQDLKNPFPFKDIEWRIQQQGEKNGKPWVMVLAYITNRAIMDRLDDVVGPENWKNEFKEGPGGGLLCGISLLTPPDAEWVTKWDGAENTDIEAVKGGLSGAMKRAAVQWGIGRYLYNLDSTFATITDQGRYRGYIKDKKIAYKWNPPTLPPWALPEGTKQPKPNGYMTDGQRNELIDIAKAANMDMKDFAGTYNISKETKANFAASLIQRLSKELSA
ncbi:MAG: recombinase [bacterium]|nr:recombinase [bacterium]